MCARSSDQSWGSGSEKRGWWWGDEVRGGRVPWCRVVLVRGLLLLG